MTANFDAHAPRASSRRAFTLVELLVGCGIIAVLMSLLLAGLAPVRREGRALQCQNNVRQLALGFMSYASMSKNKFPPNFGASPGQYWFDGSRVGGILPPPQTGSVPDRTVYACPDDDLGRRSYSMNLWASSKIDPSWAAMQPQGYRWNVVTAKGTSRLMLLVEAWSYDGRDSEGYSAPPTVGAIGGSAGRRFGGGGALAPFSGGRFGTLNCELTYARHRRTNGAGNKNQARGRIVVGFADGHVELLRNDEIVDFQSGELRHGAYWSPLDIR